MTSTEKLSEVIGGIHAKQEHLSRQFTGPGGQTVDRVRIFKSTITLQDSGLQLYERDTGSSFIVGHLTSGKLGSNLSPQPHLGDSRGSWQAMNITGLDI